MSFSIFLHHIRAILARAWMEGMSSDEFVNYLRKHDIRIGNNVHFRNPARTTIDFTRPCLIEFGDNIDVNEYFAILSHDFSTFVFRGYYNDFVNSSGKVKIGNNVVFGRNVTVLKGVNIGDNCIIGMGSIVSKSIPPNSVAVGAPAKVVCNLEEYYNKRKSLQVKEAIQYATEYFKFTGNDIPIEELKEEWCLFLCKEEYDSNKKVRNNVDFRLKNYVPINDFLSQKKIFDGYEDFINAVHSAIEEDII